MLPTTPTHWQEILASKDADHSARWLAAVHFKNSCNKYWRSRLPGWVLPLPANSAGGKHCGSDQASTP